MRLYRKMYRPRELRATLRDLEGLLRNQHKAEVSVKLTRIMSHIFHCLYTHANSTHTNTIYRCHKTTALVKDVTSNFLGGETYD